MGAASSGPSGTVSHHGTGAARRLVRARRAPSRRTLAAIAALLAVLAVGPVDADPRKSALTENIPQQSLDSALRELARIAHLQVMYVANITALRDSGRAVSSGMTVQQALESLLADTGLSYKFLNDRTVKIFALRTSGAARPADAEAITPTPMGEIVVTAGRQLEEQQHVPASIVVITRSDIDALGASDFNDVAIRTPGVEFDFYPDLGPGVHTNIAIRGIDARDGTATAIYVDDVPLRPDPTGVMGRALPLLADLEQVEVLRGPQSTLLGEAAEGGAVRFVTSAPGAATTGGYVRTDASLTERGSPSLLTIAALNAPIVQNRLALRASAGYEADGGFIDRVDPFTLDVVDRDVNRSTARTARLALTWTPADELRVTPSFMYQDRYQHDSPSFYVALSDPAAGVLRSGKLLQQPTDDELMIGAVHVSYDFPALELTSTSSYVHRAVFSITDGTNNALGWGNPLGPEYPLSDQTYLRETNRETLSQWGQELRLATADPHQRVGWLLGAFFLHTAYFQETVNSSAFNAQGVQVGDNDAYTAGYENHAAVFGDLTWQLTERLAVRSGIRLTHSTYSSTVPGGGPGAGTGGYLRLSGDESPAAPRITVSYQARPEVLYYATASTGYRLGGINPPLQPWCSVKFPQAYGPDWVVNYELGSKATLFQERATIDFSVYHMQWRHLQTDLNEPDPDCFTYIVNVGTAASDGFDLAAETTFGESVRLGLTAAYTHARYTETIMDGDQIRARDGDSLGSIPVVPSPWNLTAYAERSVQVTARCRGSLVAEDIFHSRNPGPFYSLDPASPNYDPGKIPDPSSNLLNLRAALQWSSLQLRLFVDNALDSQPTLLRRNVYVGSTLFVATTFRPRTIGTSVVWQY